MKQTIPDRASITLENWRTYPSSAYSFDHVGEFVPMAEIQPWRAGEAPSPGPGALEAMTLAESAGAEMTALDYFARSHSDHVVVMRDWRVMAEWSAPGKDPQRPHLIFSISKSVTGLLAGIAAAEGLLDPDAPVVNYVPSMEGSAYGGARVRDLLDMTVDVAFDEEYTDTDGAFDRYRRAMLWNPQRAGTEPETMEGFLGTLPARDGGEHGKRFCYASPNTDLLGLVIERAAGRRYHLYMAEKLWGPMGALGPAQVTVDRVGTSRAAGGICITTRDLARMGQLVLGQGRNRDGDSVVPAAWIEDMRRNGDRQAWIDGNFADMFDNGRYRSCWYDIGDGRGSFAAVGIHGQWLWVDPTSDVVIAKTSYQPEASDDAVIAREIMALGRIAAQFEHL